MKILARALLLGALPALSTAQGFDDRWLGFEPVPGGVDSSLSDAQNEVDLAAGDLDGDGAPDVVAVRCRPFLAFGPRTNLLLMNEGGVLVDRSATLATASEVPGDQGFLTPTQDRDVAIADLDGDGWAEVVTSPALWQVGAAKAISHPRVYHNEGGAGAWAGLRYEDARIPTLIASGGQPGAVNFNEVLCGDLNLDGALDLYFVDHDSWLSGYAESTALDLQDVLLFNDGNGFFADVSATIANPAALDSQYNTTGALADFDLDGREDVLIDRAFPGIDEQLILFNDGPLPGDFGTQQDASLSATYFLDAGDLNQDGRPDLVYGRDFTDSYSFNLGNAPGGGVLFSPFQTFDFLADGDDGFAGQIHIDDLDGDGWSDALICDVDLVLSGGLQRLHIYHNRGGTPGSTDIVMREERENASSGPGDWIGAWGLSETDLQETYDLALFDLEGDGDLDLLLGRNAGMSLWRNVPPEPITCQQDLGGAFPGGATLSMCGDALASGGSADLELTGLPLAAPTFLVFGFNQGALPLFGGTLVPFPAALVVQATANIFGQVQLPGIPGGGGPTTLYAQAAYVDVSLPLLVGFSNALRIEFLP